MCTLRLRGCVFLAAGVIAIAAPSFAYYHYLEARFSLHTRQWLTERIEEKITSLEWSPGDVT